MKRFEKNFATISKAEQEKLANLKVLVVGLGGLGGIVSEGLVRLGLYHIGICDFDLVDETNLNRQLLAYEDNLGKAKLELCKQNLLRINQNIVVSCYDKLSQTNQSLIEDLTTYDLVIDCLDNYPSRLLLHNLCIERDIKVIYGAIAGNYGYLGVRTNDNNILFDNEHGVEKQLGNPFYTPAIVGAMQIKLALDVLFKKAYLNKGFYSIDLESFTIEKIKL